MQILLVILKKILDRKKKDLQITKRYRKSKKKNYGLL